MKNKKLLVLDGTSLVNDAYNTTLTKEMENAKKMYDSAKTEEEKEVALEAKKEAYKTLLKSTSGQFINAVQEFFAEFLDILDKQNPSHVVVCWGTPRSTNYKREIFSGYKNDDKKMDEPLKEQFKTIQNILNNIGVAQYRSEKYEALDIAGSIANKFKNIIPTCIVARNQNSLQLCNNSIVWLKTSSRSKLSEQYNLDLSHVSDKFMEYDKYKVELIHNLNTEEFIDYRAIIGSPSSGIPGVKGVGEKTALPLIKYFGSIDNMYSELNDVKRRDLENPKEKILKDYTSYLKDKLGAKRLPLANIIADEHNAKISKKLVSIKNDILLEEKNLDINIDKIILVQEMKKCSLANLEMINENIILSTNFSRLITTLNPTILSPSSEMYIGDTLTNEYILSIRKDNSCDIYSNNSFDDNNDNDEFTNEYDTTLEVSYKKEACLTEDIDIYDLINKNSSFKVIEVVTSYKYQCNHCGEYFVTEGKPAKFCPHCGVKNNDSDSKIPIIENTKCSLSDMKY